jgi:hypothetical protein
VDGGHGDLLVVAPSGEPYLYGDATSVLRAEAKVIEETTRERRSVATRPKALSSAATTADHDAEIGSDFGARVCGRPVADDDSSWTNWAQELNGYLNALEELFWPQLIIVGGSTSVEFPRFEHLLDTQTPVVAATEGHNGTIIGAAINARGAA